MRQAQEWEYGPTPGFDYYPAPTHCPERDYSYPYTEGEEITRTARLLGIELMPWQRLVAELATQYRLDAFNRRIYKYAKILISVPRQSGKTTLMTPVRIHRILTRPGIECFSTAQTGKAARARLIKMVEFIESGPLSELFKSLRSNGSEGVQVKGNKSSVTRFSPVLGALHGETPYLVDFDEIWKYTEQLGDALLGGASPGQITLDGQGQIWMISTMGTQQSTFMNKWIATAEEGKDHSLAYFLWQQPPNTDPDDPQTWWAFHPALGNTIGEESLRKEMYADGVTLSERIRAYMNRLTVADEMLIDPEILEAEAIDPEHTPELSEVGIGVEVAPGNACAAVVAAWRDTDGSPVVRILHQAPGTSWVTGYLAHLRDTYDVPGVAADDAGPVKRITDDLDPLDADGLTIPALPVRRLNLAERSTADLDLIAAARDDRTLRHDGADAFYAAWAAAQTRTTNGVERLDRDRSVGPIPSLIAASVALWLYDHPQDWDQTPGVGVFV